jgi:predicted ATPase with chaperone activity
MPVDWRPENPLRDFIKDNSHSRQTEQQERYQGRVFNDKGYAREGTIRNSQRDIHEIEGSLEVQRLLLLKLAEQENRMIEKPGSGSTFSVERLESLKKDTVQAIEKTWNQSSRSTAKKRSLYPLL